MELLDLLPAPLDGHASDDPYGIAPQHTAGYTCIDFCENVLHWQLSEGHKALYVRLLEKDATGTDLRHGTGVLESACEAIGFQGRWLVGLQLWRLAHTDIGLPDRLLLDAAAL
jgi:hypothetical protein